MAVRKGKGKPAELIIDQSLLQGIVALNEQIEALKTQLNRMVSELKAAVDAGAKSVPGRFILSVEMKEGKRSVSWKAVVEEYLGKNFAKEILEQAPKGPPKPVLVITDTVTSKRYSFSGGK